MCGKFTGQVSWHDVTGFPAPSADDDRIITHRVMGLVPVIVRDGEQRIVLPMRWGFPDARDGRIPKHIHARAETIDSKPTFARAFANGQRGIVLARTFNEAPDVPGKTRQHVITPPTPVGIAMLWQRFESASGPLFACVMVTAPANDLIAGLPTDRMPAILGEEDWATWLGESDAPLAAVKACLKSVSEPAWTMAPEQMPRARPTLREPQGGLF